MLQQTQVKTVIPYYEKFIALFPTLNDLADSSLDDVLSLWTGLGYYARARNLHKSAQIIKHQYQGVFPETIAKLIQLPGIGLSTAGAILSLAMGKSAVILDGNCKRVYARCYSIEGYPAKAAIAKKFWQLAEQLTPLDQSAQYNQALMDLGSMVCLRSQPLCLKQADACPLHNICLALKSHSVMDFPTKKKTKIIPQKSAVFLILQDQKNNIYLEKRPPSGIWGGLWCFPQFLNKAQMLKYLIDMFSHFENSHYCIETIVDEQQHIFSHFRLNYTVYFVQYKDINAVHQIAENNKIIPFSIEKALQLGISTPIKNLLQKLQIQHK